MKKVKKFVFLIVSLMLLVFVSSAILLSISVHEVAAASPSTESIASNHVGITFRESKEIENDKSKTESDGKTSADLPKTGEKSSMGISVVGLLLVTIFILGMWRFNGSKEKHLNE
ncbi:LPXTG cell wall anchor domain-containing protein [Enterococcus faecalis]|uniref:LPXTG cell wall anchor domain-containing protein n=1 Tax=Enterococcus faecalis TaxID=1351 RepID=UPI0018CCF153|nr:LPXTG cell wall anchor domain-containing protein [Enterococcus faecalis]EGO5016482.1 LPXTG cell wall anchor domain-containing protein [Enterococcus faecalis]EGO6561353.1 LPXTG cell wall anchor domain-containing protein [Enterococcus faecalis]EGO7560954.1 LPXTG cell wall anchor domain-containing protein [Enterococcus faecalis]EGO7742726.1 LPXTG cell wall anchor domain-containing protein [Enterococcus faecalis]EIP7780866.1 LPXTG cell wall anchor domain-containing protein [Enterococcus faecali